jgi:hypothetical protein
MNHRAIAAVEIDSTGRLRVPPTCLRQAAYP